MLIKQPLDGLDLRGSEKCELRQIYQIEYG